jgi:hypothetical protein
MPRIFTRKRGTKGISLKAALTYKNQNGIPSTIRNNIRQTIGSGSYGTIYSLNSLNIVYKQHEIEPSQSDNKCNEWEHEYRIHKTLYFKLNSVLKRHDICIAKPYTFRYLQQINHGSKVVSNHEQASACIYTMDYISSGPKWDKYLLEPLRTNKQPPYLYFGTIKEGNNRVTLRMLKDATIVEMPNDTDFCSSPGEFGMYIQHAMMRSFFLFIENGYMPRDIEYVLDGRKRTQTLAAIVDFNQVKSIQDRADLYGEGYDSVTDTAHVYIDLCGLRTGRIGNPMAPYDELTPQWTFLCNPLVCPSAFLTGMHEYRNVAEIILEYAFTRHMKSAIEKTPLRGWKPLYVYKVQDLSEVKEGDTMIGSFTEEQYRDYRNAQCVFYTPSELPTLPTNQITAIYVGTSEMTHDGIYWYDRFVEFDVQFQHYCLAQFVQKPLIQQDDGFHNILRTVLSTPTIPQVNDGWDVLFSNHITE